MSNQPIEEKCNWREEFDEKFGVFSTNVNKRPLTSKAIESFIENLLEQERKIMAGAIEMSKLGWIDEGRIEERKRKDAILDCIIEDIEARIPLDVTPKEIIELVKGFKEMSIINK